jgi:hypothetical protein
MAVMPGSGSIDHHRPIEFAEVEMPPGENFTVTVAADGKTLLVSEVCPACGGRTVTDLPYGLGGFYGYKGLWRHPPTRPAPPARATIICECGHSHPGRPAEQPDSGCGRFWTIELPPQ